MGDHAPHEQIPNNTEPTVKGIFVRSHIDNLRKAKGQAGVKELERRFGKSLKYGNLEDVPVDEEIRLLEITLDILTDGKTPPDKRAIEAGRLHFRDFATTPWGKMVFNIFSGNLKYQMLHTSTITEKIFKGIRLRAEETGPHSLSVYIANLGSGNPDHFVGIFEAWVEQIGYKSKVTFAGTHDNESRFDITWSGKSQEQ